MTTYDRLFGLYNVVKTFIACVIVAMGPSHPTVDTSRPGDWKVPVQQSESSDNALEAAKGLLRLRYEQMPEQALKPKEELPNGVPYNHQYVVTKVV